MNKSIRKEIVSSMIILSVSTAVIVLIIFLGFIFYYNYTGLIDKQKKKSEEINIEIGGYFRDIFRLLSITGKVEVDGDNNSTDSLNNLVDSIAHHNASITYLSVVDMQGNILHDYSASNNNYRMIIDNEIETILYYLKDIQGQYISKIIKHESYPVIIAAIPVKDTDGTIVCGVISIIDLKYLNFIINRSARIYEMDIIFVDNAGNFVSSFANSEITNYFDVIESNFNITGRNKDIGVIYCGLSGGTVIGRKIIERETCWSLIIEDNLTKIFIELLIPLIIGFVIIAAILLVFTLRLRTIADMVVRPISDLLEIAAEVRAGDYSVRLEKRYHDEYQVFVDLFNEMIDSIRDRELIILEKSGKYELLNEELNQTLDELLETNHELERVNEQLRYGLEERNMLFKEVHHRVKNNLQIILSLINLQEKDIPEEFSGFFKELKSRIMTISSIHRKLYQSTDISMISLSDFISGFINELTELYFTESRYINIDMNIKNIMLSLDRSVPLCLIINEVLTNVFKYAFPPSFSGNRDVKISIDITDQNKAHLIIADNGVGFDSNLKQKSLGMSLITSLIKQINGESVLKSDHGTIWEFWFPFESDNNG